MKMGEIKKPASSSHKLPDTVQYEESFKRLIAITITITTVSIPGHDKYDFIMDNATIPSYPVLLSTCNNEKSKKPAVAK